MKQRNISRLVRALSPPGPARWLPLAFAFAGTMSTGCIRPLPTTTTPPTATIPSADRTAVPLASRLAFAPNVSTLGLGGDLSFTVSRHLALRVGGHFAGMQQAFDTKGIAYSVAVDWRSLQTLVDVYPLGNVLRVTGGIVWNGNRARMHAVSIEPVLVWDTVYSAVDAGQVSGLLSFNNIAPYLGLGIGGGRAVRFTVDLGLLFQGRPTQRYVGTTMLTGQWKPFFDQMVEDATARLGDQISGITVLRFYPVLSLGVSLPLWDGLAAVAARN